MCRRKTVLILSDNRRVPIKVLLNVDDSRHMFEKKYNECKRENSILLECLKDIYNKLNVDILDDQFSDMEAIKVSQSRALNAIDDLKVHKIKDNYSIVGKVVSKKSNKGKVLVLDVFEDEVYVKSLTSNYQYWISKDKLESV